MPRYIRAFIPGGTFFFTVTLHNRRSAILTEYIDDLRTAFADARRRRPFTIDAIVILPEHLHCIWTLPEGDGDFPSRWHDIKARFAARVPQGEALSERRLRKGERGIWQRRYWEHVVRDERDFERHLDYIHFKPVKHGHVQCAIDWPYSSLRRFVARGSCPPDWTASDEVRSLEFE
jgi:putative transposase